MQGEVDRVYHHENEKSRYIQYYIIDRFSIINVSKKGRETLTNKLQTSCKQGLQMTIIQSVQSVSKQVQKDATDATSAPSTGAAAAIFGPWSMVTMDVPMEIIIITISSTTLLIKIIIKHQLSISIHDSINAWINHQSINESMNQSIQSIHQSINQAVH